MQLSRCGTSHTPNAGQSGHVTKDLLLRVGILSLLLASSAAIAADPRNTLAAQLTAAIIASSDGLGLSAFQMPASSDYANIPQDPSNPITKEKVRLGKLLYHDTATGSEGTDPERSQTWSCASCHHAAAGFKAGIPQGIGDGGVGFGIAGEKRVLAAGLDANAADGDPLKPDVQPIASPTVLNGAYQDLMLWNGSFGNGPGSNNAAVDAVGNAGPAQILANTFRLSGLETQVIAGTKVHRLSFDNQSVMQTNSEYRYLYERAFPGGDTGYIPANDTTVSVEALGAAKAIAAYERTILSNLAPFQQWLSGDHHALTHTQMRGGLLFFGKAGCVSCHTGPALSSRPGATSDEMFFAVGFKDFDPDDPHIHGIIDNNTKKGRGGFTAVEADNYKFKIPQLYNLTDSKTLGHGSSFQNVRDVIAYKNNGVAENPAANINLAEGFKPLNLTEKEIDDLTVFVEDALYDHWLHRYVPADLPSSACFPVADIKSALELGCVVDRVIDEDICQYTVADLDGDGWGWEQGRSCRVVAGTTISSIDTAVSGSGGQRPVCQFALSDSDGDGWGREHNRSCRVLE